LVDTCDTCGRRSEVFRLPDRKDSNCLECNADISILVLLYRKWEIAERNGEHSAHLEAKIVPILHRFLERSGPLACANVAEQVCAWPEAARKENDVN
jgi:hypothetical protein